MRQYNQQCGMHNQQSNQSKYSVVSSPELTDLISKLVSIRCASDVAKDENTARHCAALFRGKGLSCFKCAIDGYQSPKLSSQKKRKRPGEEQYEKNFRSIFRSEITCM
ncbi:hypothetical protein [Megavirus chiliensis]|uniref:Uncharacterized protein n=2 Tax=Megavirus chilense TaxID=3060301 RepID=L7Y3A1_9VIRU|nr:hypothetical protein MegaChil _gp0294 [Megavirus chiliensis]AEQ33471.1 hypothetical protein [Megavirus chiliensis]AGD92199.1 hypothetical protein LBA_00279 [Megavirus lba]